MFYRRFSLVSLCVGGMSRLERSLESWLRQDYPAVEHVVVVAVGSMPTCVDRRITGSVIHVGGIAFVRPCRFFNLAARYATGEYLGFVSSNAVLPQQWVSSRVAAMRRHADVVLPDDAGCTVTKWLFEKVRGYNENLDVCGGYEMLDLCIRAQRAGGRAATVGGDARRIGGDTSGDGDELRRMQRCVCAADAAVHRFEANRVRRVNFPPETVTVIEK